MVADTLGRTVESMWSLAFIPVGERALDLDVQALSRNFVRLDILGPSRVLPCVVSQSPLFECIKTCTSLIGGDFNGHIGATFGEYDDVHCGFGFRDRNRGGKSLLDFARAFDLVIANSSFPKKMEHLVTFQSSVAETKIAYLLYRKSDRGAWRSSGDASAMWTTTAQCIREITREVLWVSKGYSGGHKGHWWWNGEVQGKVETKKAAYLKLVKSVDEEEKGENTEQYKLAKKEAKLAVTAA
ncbi:uncharacterized protein [Nicotiana tomentosiformis]|uniref:uncharacterized protein n=1 Tax=Nicotiana tomentosiformis TaxID=4098 RepID=UPI00388C7352